jgi:hypothetical protein
VYLDIGGDERQHLRHEPCMQHTLMFGASDRKDYRYEVCLANALLYY